MAAGNSDNVVTYSKVNLCLKLPGFCTTGDQIDPLLLAAELVFLFQLVKVTRVLPPFNQHRHQAFKSVSLSF